MLSVVCPHSDRESPLEQCHHPSHLFSRWIGDPIRSMDQCHTLFSSDCLTWQWPALGCCCCSLWGCCLPCSSNSRMAAPFSIRRSGSASLDGHSKYGSSAP